MPDAPDGASATNRPRAFALAALVVLLAGVLVAALVANAGVERRVADREAAAVRAAVRSQGSVIAALQEGEVVPGAPALRPIADGARQRSGGTVRIVGDGGTLLLQTDGTTRTDTSADVAAALQTGRTRTRVTGPAGSRQRITAVPFRSRGGALAVVALTPSRDALAADAAHEAIWRGAAAGLIAGAAILLAAAGYFRRKALIRSPKRS